MGLYNLVYEHGNTIIHRALLENNKKEVQLSIQKYPQFIKEKNHSGRVPLHLAAMLYDLENFKTLYLKEKSLLYEKDFHEISPLQYAAIFDVKEIFEFLLETEQDFQLDDPLNNGLNIKDMAIIYKSSILDLLLNTKKKTATSGEMANHFIQDNNISELLEVNNLDSQDILGNTVLHNAILKNQQSILKELLKQPNLHEITGLKNNEGKTPIMLALETGALNMIKDILRVTVNKFLHGNNYNALHLLLSGRNVNTVNTVELEQFRKIKSGTLSMDEAENMNIEDRFYDAKTGLHLAVAFKNKELVNKFLEMGSDCKVTDFKRNTLAHTAARVQALDLLKILYSKDAPFNIKNYEGVYPLHEAAKLGNFECFQYIHKCYRTIINEGEKSVLEISIDRGYSKQVEYILKNDGILEKESFDLALKKKNLDIIHILYNHCMNKNLFRNRINEFLKVKDDEENTLLHCAVKTDHVEGMDYILSNGFDIFIKNKKGESPLSIAMQEKPDTLFSFLRYSWQKNDGKTKKILSAMFKENFIKKYFLIHQMLNLNHELFFSST